MRRLDASMPRSGVIAHLVDDQFADADSGTGFDAAFGEAETVDVTDDPDPDRRRAHAAGTDPPGGDGSAVEEGTAGYPLVEDGWLRSALAELLDTYATALAAAQVADPDRLLDSALELLAELDMIIRVPGGVLVRPLLARYRNAVVRVRPAARPAGLFDLRG